MSFSWAWGRKIMAEKTVRHEESRGVHILVMNHGANALDRPLMDELRSELAALAAAGPPPIILASAHESIFSPGWNLKLLADAGREELGEFLALFNNVIRDLFSYPGPTAAAIGGHAVAGGCLMAIACDLRLMVEGQPRLGISELNLGVPLPADSVRMLRARLNVSALDDLVFRGDGCTAERARGLGIVHRTTTGERLLELANREVSKLASKPRRGFVETKRFLLGDVWAAMGRSAPEESDAFLDCWFEQETRERIRGLAQRLGH
jgi:enoyl-CoA hydratase/carnithine racemase